MEKLKDLIFEKFADKSIPKEVATELLLEI